MKKVYSLIAVLATTLAASAVDVTPVKPTKAMTQKVASVAKTAQAKTQVLPGDGKVQNFTKTTSKLSVSLTETSRYAVSDPIYYDGEDWKSIGTGKITNSLLEDLVGTTGPYDIEIEEAPIDGGKMYRCLPFKSEENPLYGQVASDSKNYMVFYVMDNGENLFDPFTAYGLIPFKQVNYYATFENNIFTVPVNCVAAELHAFGLEAGKYYTTNSTTPLTIALPGAKDYSVSLTTYNCVEDLPEAIEGANQKFYFSAGADAAYAMFGYLPGYWEINSLAYDEFVSSAGTKVNSGVKYGCPVVDEPGMYTAFVGAFDADNKLVGVTSNYFFINDDDAENWKKVGTATWNESLMSAAYSDIPAELLTLDYEENVETPGYYRLVNPYAAHSNTGIYTAHESHNHYIYIDATDPECVIIEASPVGTDAGYGSGAVSTDAYFDYFIYQDKDDLKEQGLGGTMADNTITFPAGQVLFGEKGYLNGAFLPTNEFVVTLSPDQVDIVATGVTIDQTELSMKVGDTAQLVATVEPEDTTDKTIVWTSSDELVAIVNAEGVVTAVAEGTTTITATCGKATATCAVTVEKADEPAKPVEVVVIPGEVELEVGETFTLETVVKNPLPDDDVITYTSSNEAVATVDAQGVVTAVAEGTATITATYAGVSATCTVTVVTKEPQPEITLTIDQTEATLEVGKTVKLTATVTGSPATDEAVNWSSTNEAVATVDSEGTVTAVAEGTATIIASYAGLSAICEVTVVAGEEDMIDEIKAAAARGELYDLQGRRVSNQTKGIVIVRQGNKIVKALLK